MSALKCVLLRNRQRRTATGIWINYKVSLVAEGSHRSAAPGQILGARGGQQRNHHSAVIGTVHEAGRFPVTMTTEIGGTRPVETPPGELLPRIC